MQRGGPPRSPRLSQTPQKTKRQKNQNTRKKRHKNNTQGKPRLLPPLLQPQKATPPPPPYLSALFLPSPSRILPLTLRPMPLPHFLPPLLLSSSEEPLAPSCDADDDDVPGGEGAALERRKTRDTKEPEWRRRPSPLNIMSVPYVLTGLVAALPLMKVEPWGSAWSSDSLRSARVDSVSSSSSSWWSVQGLVYGSSLS